MAKLKYLVIHCTATPEGREVSSADIRKWHTSPVSQGGRGWKQVGYTDLFHLQGGVERLVNNNEDAQVDPWEVTNGAKGYNSVSRHIVYAGGVVVLTEGLKGLFPNMKGWVTQLVSWCVGLVCAMLLWWLDAGFVSDVSWDIALLYGFGASLVANGVADTGLVQWVIGLFRKKREEAE